MKKVVSDCCNAPTYKRHYREQEYPGAYTWNWIVYVCSKCEHECNPDDTHEVGDEKY